MSFVATNTGLGTQLFTEEQLYYISDDDDSSSFATVSGSEIVSIKCSLNNLLYVSSISFYSLGADSASLYASKSAGGNWQSLTVSTTSSGGGGQIENYYDTIRLDITASSSGTELYSIDISLEDINKVKFGTFGLESEYDIDKNYTEPQEIKILNYTGVENTGYVFITESGAGTGLYISAVSGTDFYNYHGNSVSIPNDFSWDTGQMNNVVVSGTSLTISGGQLYGYYISPILELDNTNVIRPFFEATLSGSSYIDFPGEIEGPRTMGVRVYNVAPTGVWSSGQLADESDENWSIRSGSISFVPYRCDMPFTCMYNDETIYAQFYVGLYSTISGETPILSKAGVEYPVVASGIPSNNSGSVYLKCGDPNIFSSGPSGLDTYFLV